MAEYPALPLWTDAYLADTHHLDDADRGRYDLILITLWRAPKQRIPDDDEWLARRFNRSVERVQAELRPIIMEFCATASGWITQKRLSREWKFVEKRVRQRRSAANSRWNKDKEPCGRTSERISARNAPTPTPTPPDSVTNGESSESRREGVQGERDSADAKAPASPSTRATRIPDDWQPSEAERAFAQQEGFSDAEIDRIASEFADYWRGEGGQRARKVRWGATFRNRIRHLVDTGSRRRSNGAAAGHDAPRNRSGPGSFARASARVLASAGDGGRRSATDK